MKTITKKKYFVMKLFKQQNFYSKLLLRIIYLLFFRQIAEKLFGTLQDNISMYIKNILKLFRKICAYTQVSF